MANLEEVLPAYRAGKRIRREGSTMAISKNEPMPWPLSTAMQYDDWEIVPEPVTLVTREEVDEVYALNDREVRLKKSYLLLLDVAERGKALVQDDSWATLGNLIPEEVAFEKALRAAGMLP